MERHNKGRNLIAFPANYIVIDTETTGLDFDYCNLIEIAAIRYENNLPVEEFSSLIKPPLEKVYRIKNGTVVEAEEYVSPFITDLTGISNEMLASAPEPKDVLQRFCNFVKDAILIGHNVNFDINFLYDAILRELGTEFSNDFIDTLRISRKEFPGLSHHRLSDIACACNINQKNAHRALDDCSVTAECYTFMKSSILSQMNEDEFVALFKKKRSRQTRVNYAEADGTDFCPSTFNLDDIIIGEENPFYMKTVAFTGALEKMPRKDACNLVAYIGGIPSDSVSKKTNYLVIGNKEFVASVKNEKTNKMRKAEEMALKGIDIHIISENAFFDMLT